MLDRRRFLIATQAWMLVFAALLAATTSSGTVDEWRARHRVFPVSHFIAAS